jgi:hypothetical protein
MLEDTQFVGVFTKVTHATLGKSTRLTSVESGMAGSIDLDPHNSSNTS